VDGIELNQFESTSLHPLRHRMQMVFQNQYASLNPRMYFDEIVSA
jgi:ABC-type microcin C transport system duplicated ATPase subunit YejF